MTGATGHVEAARLCLKHGADVNRTTDLEQWTPDDVAKENGHDAMAAWLARVRVSGWAKHLSEPRYALVVLRELVAGDRARREREFSGNERVLDFLFPGEAPRQQETKTCLPRVLDFLFSGDQPPPQADLLHLPDDLFPLVARYYWGGET
mmetsp:Transcript_15457/g.47849  ORF Transcript_15457/g.47849 Transcript_15457/m.47849 type:complete len:150 (-) Transcript_15457:267-716(-)